MSFHYRLSQRTPVSPELLNKPIYLWIIEGEALCSEQSSVGGRGVLYSQLKQLFKLLIDGEGVHYI
jgi:hypothetical protein